MLGMRTKKVQQGPKEKSSSPNHFSSESSFKDLFEFDKCLRAIERLSHASYFALIISESKVLKDVERMPGVNLYLIKPLNAVKFSQEESDEPEFNSQMFGQDSFWSGKEISSLIDKDKKFLFDLFCFIRSNIDRTDLTTKELEEYVGMSHSQFHRALKRLIGLSGKKFIREIRIQKARELLTKGELQVSEISYLVGFNDPQYFSKVFKKEVGVSPTVFRG